MFFCNYFHELRFDRAPIAGDTKCLSNRPTFSNRHYCARTILASLFTWAPFVVITLQVVTAQGAGQPEVAEWWSKATRIWSGEVTITVTDSFGLAKETFGTGKSYEYSFDDTLKCSK